MSHSSNQIANAITTALAQYIEGREEFICNALEAMERRGDLSTSLCDRCVREVRASIEQHYTFESYYDFKNGFLKVRLDSEYREERIKHFKALIVHIRKRARS